MAYALNLFFLLLWPIITVFVSFTFNINALESTLLFYGVPSIILSIQKRESIQKTFFVSLFILPIMTVIDYVAQITKTWIWPLPHSVFPFTFFGHVSVEVLLWAFLHMYFVIIFYQYFFEKIALKKFWNKRAKEALVGTLLLFSVFFLVFFFYPTFLHIPFWYFTFGVITILPVVILEDFRFPKVFPKLLKTAIYFFYVNLLYEVSALRIGWWAFPSKQFIGHVSVFGVTFPFEEFFFWLILFTLAILSYYEYFFNKER